MDLLLNQVFKNKNLVLAKVLLDKSDLTRELFCHSSYYNSYRDDVSFLQNKESFNFVISYLANKKKLDVLKAIFSNSHYVNEVAQYATAKSFKILRKFIKKNWFFSNGSDVIFHAVSNNNSVFVAKELIRLAKEQSINPLSYVRVSEIAQDFLNEDVDLRMMSILKKECDSLGEDILNSHLSSYYIYRDNEYNTRWLQALKRIMRFFQIKSISLRYVNPKSFARCDEIFFYILSKLEDRSQLLRTSYYGDESLILESLGGNSISNTKVAKFLLKENLKYVNERIKKNKTNNNN